MKNYILSIIFLDLYKNIKSVNIKKENIDYEKLEDALEQYLINVVDYRIKYHYQENFNEIKVYFENIIYNTKDMDLLSVVDNIKAYQEQYLKKRYSHYYVGFFIDTMKRLYSKSYNGKIISADNSLDDNIIYNAIAIKNIDNSFTLSRRAKRVGEDLPPVSIIDLGRFEKVLKDYIDTIKSSDSFYNIFNNKNFLYVKDEDKIRMIFESTMLNASNNDLLDIERFFKKYISFVSDDTFNNLKKPTYIGNMFNDSLYVMLKRSELEYETPYYFAFMLNNKFVELPNVRLGIEVTESKKIAHIMATQTAQKVLNYNNLESIQKEIKDKLPKDSYFRFYNPTHLVSILMTLGILNGMGIKEIDVNDFLPFRYNKTILDKQFSQDEAEKHQTRLTNKNLITYMRLISMTEGIDVVSFPEIDMSLKIKLNDDIKCKNDFLQTIYDMCYNLGNEYKNNNDIKVNIR